MKKKIEKVKKITKAKLAKMARTKKRKDWKTIADSVRNRDGNVCCVCGQPHKSLNVHHLIPRETKEYWLEPMNLLSLCPRHHKFSFTESFHKCPFWSFRWMQINRPDQLAWVMKRVEIKKDNDASDCP